MLSPLTITELIHHQHHAALPCPRHSHVLQFALCFRVVMAMNDDNSGHFLAKRRWQIEVRCDVHAEMLAYIMVMKNPYFAVTDTRGRFEIPDSKFLGQSGVDGAANIPPGKYFIKTWHEKLKTKKQALVVSNEDPVSIQLDLTRGTPSVLYK